MQKVNITEAFKQFCRERHAEDKGRNFNLLQEIYAKTEFFDISLIEDKPITVSNFSKKADTYMASFPIEDFSMPFENMFIKMNDKSYGSVLNQYLFLREYAPNIITGTVYVVSTNPIITRTINAPFTIRLDKANPILISDLKLKEEGMGIDNDKFVEGLFIFIINACYHLNNLSKREVIVDRPLNSNAKEYYRRKNAPTIQVPQRPIYYVLEKSEAEHKQRNIVATGTLEYSHAFKVRGHYRRISEKSIGKDRYGNYNIYGFTWVTEHVKGEGELTKRLRVLK